MILQSYCGYIIILGKTNVGKSTLFNKMIKKKISIVSKKSQTTTKFIKGIYTENNYQMIFLDTPGFLKKTNIKNYLSSFLFEKPSLFILVVEKNHWGIIEDKILNNLKIYKIPVLLVINKIDKLKNKSLLLPYVKFINNKTKFLDIFFISAKKNYLINELITKIKKIIPKKKHYFPENYITDCSKEFLLAEIIREQFLIFFNDEIPYKLKINIDHFFLDKKNLVYKINSTVFTQRESQKKILIGTKGIKIKKITFILQKKIKKFLNYEVDLVIWIKLIKK